MFGWGSCIVVSGFPTPVAKGNDIKPLFCNNQMSVFDLSMIYLQSMVAGEVPTPMAVGKAIVSGFVITQYLPLVVTGAMEMLRKF